jgi:hypothetical protein
MKADLPDHRKFLRLVRLVNEPAPHVLGYLLFMWRRAYQMGSPFLGDELDVEAAAVYTGEPGKFTRAAASAGFLDLTDGGYIVHDLYAHAPEWAKKRLQRNGFGPKRGESNCNKRPDETRTNGGENGGSAAGCRTNGGETGGEPAARRTKTKEQRTEKKEKNHPPTPSAAEGEPGTALAVVESQPEPATATDVPIPSRLDTAAFRDSWATWLADRRERRKPVTVRAAVSQLESLESIGPAAAVECIRASIANQWQGLFPERFRGRGGGGFKARGAVQDDYAIGILCNAAKGGDGGQLEVDF